MRVRILLPILLFFAGFALGSAKPVAVTPTGFGSGKQPQATVDSDGKVHVVFGKENSVFYVNSTNHGATFSAPQLVGTLPKLALGMRRGPRITAESSNIVVTAISFGDGNLYSWQSPDGKSWTKERAVNDSSKSAREGLHALAAREGKYFSVWLDLRNGKMELWGSMSRDGGKSWGKNLPIYKSPSGTICECCHPSVMFTSQNEIVVMWRNFLAGSRDMYVAISEDEGRSFKKVSKLGRGTWPLSACPMDGGALVLKSSGDIATVWRRDSSVYVTMDDFLSERLVGVGSQPVMTFAGDEGYVVWQKGTALEAKRLGTARAQVLTEKGAFPVLVTGANGVPIVLWESTIKEQTTIYATALKAP